MSDFEDSEDDGIFTAPSSLASDTLRWLLVFPRSQQIQKAKHFHLSTSSTPDPVSSLYQPDISHEGRKEIAQEKRKS